MGYAAYTLPDGREAGYAITAACDQPECSAEVTRGLDRLCGESPDGHRRENEPGCGKYYYGTHEQRHACPRPACGADENNGSGFCGAQLFDHAGPHRDQWDDHEFTEVETDEAYELDML